MSGRPDATAITNHMAAADIEDIEGVRLWATEHDARVDSLWLQQASTNTAVLSTVNELTAGQRKLELRQIWILALAAAGGGGMGAALVKLIPMIPMLLGVG